MDTTIFIKKLATEVPSKRSFLWPFIYALGWGAITLFVLALMVFILPIRGDLSSRMMHSTHFWIESILWLAATIACARISYKSTIPGMLEPGFYKIVVGLSLGLFVTVLSRWSPSLLFSEFLQEMDFYRGRCGIVILVTGALSTAWMFFLIRKAAPTRLGLTGAWSAAATGSLASLLMQFVCEHENTLHLLLWHFTPIFILSFAGSYLGMRFLRW